MAIDTTLETRLHRFKASPTETDAIRLSEELLLEGRAAEALEVIQTVQMVVQERSRIWILEGAAKSKLGDLIGAQAAWIKAAKFFPSDKIVFSGLVDVLIRRGDHARALKVFERLQTLAPRDLDTLRLGRLLRDSDVPSEPSTTSERRSSFSLNPQSTDEVPPWFTSSAVQEDEGWVSGNAFKRSTRTSTVSWFSVAWILVVGSVGAGTWYWHQWIEQRHQKANTLTSEAIQAIMQDDYPKRLIAERKLRQAHDLYGQSADVRSALLLLQAQRTLEDGQFAVALLRTVHQRIADDGKLLHVPAVLLSEAILHVADGKPREAQQIADVLSRHVDTPTTHRTVSDSQTSENRLERTQESKSRLALFANIITYLARRVLQHTRSAPLEEPTQTLSGAWQVAIEDAYLSGDRVRALSLAEKGSARFPERWTLNAWSQWLKGSVIPSGSQSSETQLGRLRIDTQTISPAEKAWLGVVLQDEKMLFDASITDPQAKRLLARMLIDNGRSDLAQALASQAMLAQPWVSMGREILAQASINLGDGLRALDALSPLPMESLAVVRLAARAALLVRVPEVLSRVDAELARQTHHKLDANTQLEILALRTRILVAQGKTDEAAISVSKLREASPKGRTPMERLEAVSDYYLAKGWNQPDFYPTHNAVLLQGNRSAGQPSSPLARRIALATMRMGRDAQAITLLKEWLDAHPNDFEAMFWLASLLESETQCVDAQPLFEALATREDRIWIDSQDAIALEASRLGRLGLERCDTSDVKSSHVQIASRTILTPTQDSSVFETIWRGITLAKRLAAEKKTGEAVKTLQAIPLDAHNKIIARTPVLARAVCGLWASVEKWPEAKETCSALVQSQPANLQAWTTLGDVFTGMGRKREAKDAYDQAQSLKNNLEARQP